jgi:hypothetical protein
VVVPGGEVIALVSSTGTKSLLLRRGGGLIRELDRSYYHADAYRYPLALFTLPDGLGDVFDMRGLIGAEISGACFIGDDVAVSTSAEPNDPEGPDDLAPCMLARWSVAERRFTWRRQLEQTAGDLLPMAGGILALHQHPRLYDAGTGELVMEWPELSTGTADSSIVWDKAFSGLARIAIDESSQRFAVTDGRQVTVVSWTETLTS